MNNNGIISVNNLEDQKKNYYGLNLLVKIIKELKVVKFANQISIHQLVGDDTGIIEMAINFLANFEVGKVYLLKSVQLDIDPIKKTLILKFSKFSKHFKNDNNQISPNIQNNISNISIIRYNNKINFQSTSSNQCKKINSLMSKNFQNNELKNNFIQENSFETKIFCNFGQDFNLLYNDIDNSLENECERFENNEFNEADDTLMQLDGQSEKGNESIDQSKIIQQSLNKNESLNLDI